MTLVGLAARNCWRNRLRASLTVLGVSITVVAFLVLRTVTSTWDMAGDVAAKDRIATRHKLSFAIALPRHYVDKLRTMPELEAVTWLSWFGGKDLRHPEATFASFAVDAASFLSVYDELDLSAAERARWLADRQGAIVGNQLARRLGLKAGDSFSMSGTLYPGDWPMHVSAIYTPSRKSFDPGALLMHWSYVDQSLPEPRRESVGWIASRIRADQSSAAVAHAIDGTFSSYGHRTRTISERDFNLSFVARFSSLMKAVKAMSGLLLLILTLILANTISMGVRERIPELGAMRALGFSAAQLRWLVMGEGCALGLAAGVLGVALGSSLINGFLSHVVEDNAGAMFPFFRLDGVTMLAALALSCALGWLASLIPAFTTGRLAVADALRRPE
ncbi:MAG: ABC transporter permease [Myxococcales bacterium]